MELYIVYCSEHTIAHPYRYIAYLEVFSKQEDAIKQLKNTEWVFNEEKQLWSKWYIKTKKLK